ncbi:NADPH-dependent assimilatory sulfite reductase hemoprotein subunit [Devosia sp.]|uniref:NADPH-dependent assimilatory sulfite reductase hemoprotein subunit n=1 Tax=Devosia sp. TaxID=1871048 RepID=UPI002AFE729C|nr:NADPH-dependent assimilatory sulfite reductase hemoprotein subunit [Devosia sp.]
MDKALPTDRSADLSQPLDRLGPDETLKHESDQLRGTILQNLADGVTWSVSQSNAKLLKFQGIYQQDDRDVREERRRQKLEPAYQFMARVRLPGGVCTPAQWLRIDSLARRYGGDTLRLTTRQTFQFHWLLRHGLRPVLQGLHEVGLDTVAACGDDSRGVMCAVNPELSALHAELAALAQASSDRAIPRMRAYREIWYGEARQPQKGPEEPFYGTTYMPRKFKIGFVLPPSNDIDVYAQDLGYIAIVENGEIIGFNVAIGGGMGRTDRVSTTYPRLASVIGYIPKDRFFLTTEAVMSVQRDYGNRADRTRARFKYTIDDKGLGWVADEIARRQGFAFEPARPVSFTGNGDTLGWSKGEDGRHHFTLYIRSGRLNAGSRDGLMDGLRAVAEVHKGSFRLTPNQNLIIADITPRERGRISELMAAHGLDSTFSGSALRQHAMSCVAFPTCGLAMAESERYLPDLLERLEPLLEKHGLTDTPITLRLSGCPNGCSRPYIAEIALTGRAPGKYNLYIGGGFHGERLGTLVKENVGEAQILGHLDTLFGRYAAERSPDEHFGDFCTRIGAAEAA